MRASRKQFRPVGIEELDWGERQRPADLVAGTLDVDVFTDLAAAAQVRDADVCRHPGAVQTLGRHG